MAKLTHMSVHALLVDRERGVVQARRALVVLVIGVARPGSPTMLLRSGPCGGSLTCRRGAFMFFRDARDGRRCEHDNEDRGAHPSSVDHTARAEKMPSAANAGVTDTVRGNGRMTPLVCS